MYQHFFDLYFTTATISDWKHLLKCNDLKDIIVDALRHLVAEKKAVVYEFVIMPNHIHIIWHIPEPHQLVKVKATLLSFTGHRFKKYLSTNQPENLDNYLVNLKDRKYQFWERNALSIPIYHNDVFLQKARYIHLNPIAEKWGLATIPENYIYSSAYRITNPKQWDFLTEFG